MARPPPNPGPLPPAAKAQTLAQSQASPPAARNRCVLRPRTAGPRRLTERRGRLPNDSIASRRRMQSQEQFTQTTLLESLETGTYEWEQIESMGSGLWLLTGLPGLEALVPSHRREPVHTTAMPRKRIRQQPARVPVHIAGDRRRVEVGGEIVCARAEVVGFVLLRTGCACGQQSQAGFRIAGGLPKKETPITTRRLRSTAAQCDIPAKSTGRSLSTTTTLFLNSAFT